MSNPSEQANWERRWHPLLSQWVVIAATTGNRPWNGATVGEDSESAAVPEHDESCYLCARNTRSNGEINPDYKGPWAFDNDYASFSPNAPSFEAEDNSNPLHRRASNQGRCRVLCWTERHDKTLASIDKDTMLAVGKLWQTEYNTLSQDAAINQVLIFENKGQEIGVSNPHPHGQIYATGFVGDSFVRARQAQAEWAKQHNSVMLLDLIARDEYQASLKVSETEHFVAVIPYFARFAYECWIIPKQAVKHIGEMSDAQRDDLALLYQAMAKSYNVLFQRESPNISLMYNAPCDDHQDNQHWQFHFIMQPPLREPDKLKYLAGFESGTANIVNPVQPEVAAQRLRDAFESVEKNT
ncbi:galactose-1-phosphate uridylyltransferase [Leucothrix sargassi]|nr:galactose-1-phosphate uridylyltransferase [Leucothrix sargassi]